MNAISIDRSRWQEQGVSENYAMMADRLALAYEHMGAKPTFTCAPYQLPDPPVFGEHIAWAESNAVAYANSVIGSRTNRYGDFIDICAALTGRVPLSGYHLNKERLGTILIKLPDLRKIDSTFYPVLGYLVGSYVGSGVPVIDGLPDSPSSDDLKAFGAAAATAGAVGMFHMVGITPEAPTIEAAFGDNDPPEEWEITRDELIDVWKKLSTAHFQKVDQVLMGSPHFSLDECYKLSELVSGKYCDPRIEFLITTNDFVYERAKNKGLVAEIEKFGARFNTNICLCMLNNSIISKSKHTLMTNSGKFAHYGPGLLDRGIYFGSMENCVQTAIDGKLSITMPL
ncbi:aconitase X catalytic domain-containing protein [Salicibibacter cibarius]|uniref:Aconitase X catalytic domain-containing protein n=1 Tax=Salicibibacter cibarius TaxID=2743000 RepID=A0A7T6Z7Q5_9BACI|nr:aconitase X catalytic domain-containing protein [Salicibibacter cibarius]QQK78429.1 aconitase X catalytic domain-containing protein [Salicibibacter cibarius]